MAIKVVKKKPTKVTGVKTRSEGVRSALPRSTPSTAPASPVKWVVVGVLAFMVVVGLLLAAAVNQGRKGSSGGGIRFVHGGSRAASARRPGRDRITESMGGKSMKEWCAENEKDNEMVQARRARRKGKR